ncbi:MAG: hypothetical protein WCC80_14185, partial [Pseudolabrys sp.]
PLRREIGPELCELFHIGSQDCRSMFAIGIVHGWERQMSIEFNHSYIEEVVMLGALALFLVLAAVMPA